MSIKTIVPYLAGSVFLFSIFPVFANPQSLVTFDELLQALDSGKKVRAIVHFDKCKLESGRPLLSKSAGVDFNEYNHFNMPVDAQHSKEVITISKTVFSITDTFNIGAVNNYFRLNVYTDNTVQLFAAILDPATYQQKLAVSYICAINSDVQQAGIILYSNEY